MIILHGFPYSNYYNIAKHVLLHKEIPFTEHLTYGSEADWLAISPLGKVPALTTEGGRQLSESSVICDYLEERYPHNPLYPEDAGERASVRQIMKIAELYMELPCRRLIPFLFQGTTAPEALREEVRTLVERGIGALTRLCQFSPWLAGEQFTMADIYVRYVNTVVKSPGCTKLEWDILAQIPHMTEWDARMADSPLASKIDADSAANAEDFFAYLQRRFAS